MKALLLILFLFIPVAAQQPLFAVDKIIDGDTLILQNVTRHLRLIGINAPENSNKCHEQFGPQAKQALIDLLAGHQVYLKFDRKKVDNTGAHWPISTAMMVCL